MTEPEDIFAESVMPLALIKEQSLRHNVAVLAEYCEQHEMELAPHVKTTMSPELFGIQSAAGAWGATVATAAQGEIVRNWGASRILVASQLVDPGSLRWLIEATQEHPDIEFVSWLDSAEALGLLENQYQASNAQSPIGVAIELGHTRGRTGMRSVERAVNLAREVSASGAIALQGVAAFEGTVADSRSQIDKVDALVEAVAEAFVRIDAEGLFAATPAFVTVGGSAYFDRVARGLASIPRERARVVLRSGCYVTHDCGIYDDLSPLGSHGADALRSALEVWGAVLSTPEQGLAIANLGRRDVSFDAGLPRVIRVRRSGQANGARLSELGGDDLQITALNDQHAFISDPELTLSVGDLIGVCISHPCTTFDKWRRIELVDEGYRPTGRITTEFP